MIFSWLVRLARACGFLPSKSAADLIDEANRTHEQATRFFAGVTLEIYRVDEQGWPTEPTFGKLADITGLGSALCFISAHAREAGPGRYRVCGRAGDVVVVVIDENHIRHIEEWCDPKLWAKHLPKVRQKPPVAA